MEAFIDAVIKQYSLRPSSNSNHDTRTYKNRDSTMYSHKSHVLLRTITNNVSLSKSLGLLIVSILVPKPTLGIEPGSYSRIGK